MEYNYKLEDYSNEYAQLLENRAKITDSLDQSMETMKAIDDKEAVAKEAWLQAEVDALLDPKKSGMINKTHAEYRAIISEREQLADRMEILKRAGEKIQQDIQTAKDVALGKVIQIAKKDHEKAAAKSVKLLRELAAAQAKESAIYNALVKHVGSFTSAIMPTQRLVGVDLGDEQTYGSVMFKIIRELESRGYKV